MLIMPKLKSRPPKLGKDKGYAVVYSGGKKIPLGCKYGTEEARKAYCRWLAEFEALGDAAIPHKKDSYCVEELALNFLNWGKGYYGKSDFGNYKNAIETMLEIYTGTSVDVFGPKALIVVQNRFVEKGYARKHCNTLTKFVRAVFRWGVAQELVSASVADALKYVPPLRKGKTIAPERPPRKAVPDAVVNATLPYLSPTIADMVRIQRLAAMRPSEVCRMQVGDVDCSKEIWVYRPGNHKGTWREHHKAVALGRHEQAILAPRMLGKMPDQYVFTPKEAMQERRERDAGQRKTKVQPSQQARRKKRAENQKRKYGESYNANSYRRPITRAIKTVNEGLPVEKQIPHWFPYMLRHAAVTDLAETDGLDVARAVAGQRSVDVTQRYNHADERIALKAASQRHNPFE
jgi:integrase